MKISPERIKQIIREEVSHAHSHHQQDDKEGVRMRRHLHRISGLVDELDSLFDDDGDVAEWVQEKIAVAAAMLQTILDYKNGEEIR